MTATLSGKSVLTLGEVAQAVGCKLWQLQAAYRRGLLPAPPKVGALRVVRVEDLSAVEATLRGAGYLPNHENKVPQ